MSLSVLVMLSFVCYVFLTLRWLPSSRPSYHLVFGNKHGHIMLTFEIHPPKISAKLPASGAIAAIVTQMNLSGMPNADYLRPQREKSNRLMILVRQINCVYKHVSRVLFRTPIQGRITKKEIFGMTYVRTGSISIWSYKVSPYHPGCCIVQCGICCVRIVDVEDGS